MSIVNRDIEVIPFSEPALIKLFTSEGFGLDQVRSNFFLMCMIDYLVESTWANLKIQTIVFEKKFVSSAYLSDYSAFYSTVFYDYSRFTGRINLFTKKIQNEKVFLKDCLKLSSDLEKHYVGNLVLKPLSSSVVGACFFKSSINNSLSTQIVEPFTFNLGGVPLTVRGLGFLPQDFAVGACATSALWTAFLKTSKLFHTDFPSSSKITESAGLGKLGRRRFPNAGLQNRQIARAIEANGLAPELRLNNEAEGEFKLRSTYVKRFISAYVNAGIPVILGIKILRKDSKEKREEDWEESNLRHMVTIVGYEYKEENTDSKNAFSFFRHRLSDIRLVADSINSVIVHNDQTNPYSRLMFTSRNENRFTFKIKGKNFHGEFLSLIVPLHPHIRVRYDDIIASVRKFSVFLLPALKGIIEQEGYDEESMRWDIYLAKSNDYKRELIQAANDKKLGSDWLRKEIQYKVLPRCFPKFVWVAKLTCVDKEKINTSILNIVYDGSEVPSGFCCFSMTTFKRSHWQHIWFALYNLGNETSATKTILAQSKLTLNHLLFIRKSLAVVD